jgi:hypothetical protein
VSQQRSAKWKSPEAVESAAGLFGLAALGLDNRDFENIHDGFGFEAPR